MRFESVQKRISRTARFCMLRIGTAWRLEIKSAAGTEQSSTHAAIQDRVLVGMNAILMDGAEVGAGSIIGAGALSQKVP